MGIAKSWRVRTSSFRESEGPLAAFFPKWGEWKLAHNGDARLNVQLQRQAVEPGWLSGLLCKASVPLTTQRPLSSGLCACACNLLHCVPAGLPSG